MCRRRNSFTFTHVHEEASCTREANRHSRSIDLGGWNRRLVIGRLSIGIDVSVSAPYASPQGESSTWVELS